MNVSKNEPVYRFDFSHAREHGEVDTCRNSYRANIACRDALDEVMRNHYDGMRLDVAPALAEVEEEFSRERIVYVVANTIQIKDWDGRFSTYNKDWAGRIPVTQLLDGEGKSRNYNFEMTLHSCLVDGLATYLRKEMSK